MLAVFNFIILCRVGKQNPTDPPLRRLNYIAKKAKRCNILFIL